MGDKPPPPDLKRERGAFVLRDDAAGYYRVLEPWEVSRIARQATELVHVHVMCEGRIPARD